MSAWDIQGPTRGTCKSWREMYSELGQQVERITAPSGRGIAWEGSNIWVCKERAAITDVVFTQALPTNAAGKTHKPPLIDQWGGVSSSGWATAASSR
jgi:hypothetical protein